MSKSTLDKRIKAYEDSMSGKTVRGVKTASVDSRAFHKPGSNKK
jgi:hypothetical protein